MNMLYIEKLSLSILIFENLVSGVKYFRFYGNLGMTKWGKLYRGI